MSTNPYQPPSNPYADAPPPGGGYGMPPGDKDYARGRLKIPAIVLMVLAALTAILRVVAIVFLLQQAGENPQAHPMMLPELAGHGLPLLLNIAVMAGCFKMLNAESYSSAMTAAIISVIPCCTPGLLLGIPFGIWAIVVLFDPRVKAAFR